MGTRYILDWIGITESQVNMAVKAIMKERKMTPFEEKGWDENTVLEVIENQEKDYKKGVLVKLKFDDESKAPLFEGAKGVLLDQFGDKDCYIPLDDLKEYKVDKKETLKQTIAEAKASIEK